MSEGLRNFLWRLFGGNARDYEIKSWENTHRGFLLTMSRYPQYFAKDQYLLAHVEKIEERIRKLRRRDAMFFGKRSA
ncbi:MAG: hypothetical protein Q7T18_09015 [Sedimentisphaerales bacterium]|nr:hypothetical protein [Sedimentisphaerales bacterium]